MSKAFIKSRPVSFRRAGIEFNRAGREIDLAALTKDQVAAIYAEPNLEVMLLELPKKAAKVTPPVKSDTGKASPDGGEPPAGAGASNNPASSGSTQGVDGGSDAGKGSAAADGTATTAPGSAAPAAKPVKPVKAKATP